MTHPPAYHALPLPSGVTISYTTAGSPPHPTLLLLHGFPSSSHQYRNLIPLLSPHYHILAPSLPGFGLTTTPPAYTFTFSSLTHTISEFLTTLNINSYAAYIFDYGAPILFRLALQDPSPIKAIISQSGNAYLEGLVPAFWAPMRALWASNNGAKERDDLRSNILSLATTRYQYVAGVPDADIPLIDPTTWTLDYLQNLQDKENQEIQLDLLYDYRTNVELYPKFQAYLRESQVPLLAIWGKGDPAFGVEGAKAFKRDVKSADVRFVDAGHFALETKGGQIGEAVRVWLGKVDMGGMEIGVGC
ncbi:hypothetical protein JMJ35_004462 [Cladonia borealis]|uniref:AB hydrolase-1 domain-containing protein n=1 Tax=Cladonia borealis TaxID=184061 RepID=A0AA39UBI2_9LECA|nr:hypothetical protein JMJ35_004462 [Cladonia borealis]